MAVLVSVVVSVLVSSWCLKLLHMIWWKPKMIEKQLKKQGIYGLPYRLFYGNSKEMKKLSKETGSKPLGLSHDILHLDPFLQKMVLTYNKIFVTWFGTTPRVTIMDPKLITEILTNKSGDFRKNEINSFTKLFVTGLANYDGDKWAKHRKIINPAFHVEKLKQMLPAFSTCSEEMIEEWEKLAGMTGSCELDVSLEFQKLTSDMISRAAFGSSFQEGRMIFLLQKKQGQLLLRSLYKMMNFPWLRFLPTKANKRMWHIYNEVRVLLRGIIEKREKAIQSGNADKDDLLGLLLKSNFNELQENKNSNAGMTTEDVIEECKLFYLAGQGTTESFLTWSMITLSMHTSWQEQAREEVFRIIGKNKPTFDNLSHLKIVNMILLEVLRLYPPPGTLVRYTHKKTKVGGFSLPAGLRLTMPLHLVHRDPEQWGEDALEFNPERFSEGVSKATKDPIAYFPFGWGPRICIGQNFSMLEVKLALSLILQHFSFELSPSYTHAPQTGITLQPQYAAQIILYKL